MYKQISYVQKSTTCKLSNNEQLKIQTEAPMLGYLFTIQNSSTNQRISKSATKISVILQIAMPTERVL